MSFDRTEQPGRPLDPTAAMPFHCVGMFNMIRAWTALVCLLVIVGAGMAQRFENLGFEEGCDTCSLGVKNWRVAWVSEGVTCHVVRGGNGKSLVINSDSLNGVGYVDQETDVEVTGSEMVISVSASIASENVSGGRGAGLYLSGYDRDGSIVFSKDLGFGSFKWINGTRDMDRYEVSAVCGSEVDLLRLGIILYGTGTISVDDVRVSTTPTGQGATDVEAAAYVDAACEILSGHALNRDLIDLGTIREAAYRVASLGEEPMYRHLAVEYLLQRLGDHHSFFMDPELMRMWEGEDPSVVPQHYAETSVVDGYGYVMVPSFQSNDVRLVETFADSLQRSLESLAEGGVRGWIIDLRQNSGGNMAPMVCGLGPLLDEGELGRLYDVEDGHEAWWYRRGAYGWGGEIELELLNPLILTERLPIAVLLGPGTGSSGEATAVSFIGNSRTRSFGQPTWGLTTGNGNYDMPDGARIFLASTIMANRSGRKLEGPIVPDEIIGPNSNVTKDTALEAALDWLRDQ